MIKFVDAVVLFSGEIDKTVAFYRALGITLEEEVHDSGPVHYAGEVGGAHFAIYESSPGEAPSLRTGGSTQVGFQVADLDDALRWVHERGAQVLIEPQDVPWGRRALVLDPDGRAVELNQASAGDAD